jgi:hypothetical protein
MPKTKKPKKTPKYKYGAVISDKVGNYENDPFFVKKAEKAKASLEANPLPEWWVKKH